ncbi:MAG: GGDEF domain-containing protein, partial [Candidatus Omnitrophota bacterium]
MLCIILLIITSSLLIFTVNKLFYGFLLKEETNLLKLNASFEKLSEGNEGLKAQNEFLEKTVQETIALYDITKDICKTLDENEMFNILQDRMSKYIKVDACKFIKSEEELKSYSHDTALELKIDKIKIGYLAAKNVREEDREKFNILAQQFLVGMKRSLLYQKVQELAITDGLTQVFSRRYFMDRFEEELKRSKRFKLELSFLMIDIDRFKEFNDRYGHLVGDAILREVSRTIKENIRQVDFMGRYGGEELSIVLTDTDKEQARLAAERIRAAVESESIHVYDENL